MAAEPAWLTIDCEGERRFVRLDLQLTTIGRNEGNVVDLPDKKLSRFHCEVARRGDDYVLRDCGSRNGTSVNGVRVNGEVVLAEGDAIEIGGSRLLFRTARPVEAQRDHAIPIQPLPRSFREATTFRADKRRLESVDLTGMTPAEPFDPRPTLQVPPPPPPPPPPPARVAAPTPPTGVATVPEEVLAAPRMRSFAEERWPRLVQAIRLTCEVASAPQLLARLADVTLDLVPARQVSVLLPALEAGQPPRVVAVRPQPAEGAVAPRVSSSIVEEVLRTAKPLSIQDVKRDERFENDLSVLGMNLGGTIAVPLRALGRVRGVLYVDEPTVVFPSEREEAIAFLGALGDAAGVALVATGSGAAIGADEASDADEAARAARRAAELLPPASGIELALRVVPGRGAFAEVQTLPERGGRREIVALLGRFAGTPLDAARIEAATRAAFRALARTASRGDGLLLGLEDALAHEVQGRALEVVLFRLDPLTREARVTIGGLGPVVHRSAKGAVHASGGAGAPIGSSLGADGVSERVVNWEAGDLLVATAPPSVGLAAAPWLPASGSAHDTVDRIAREHARDLGAVLVVARTS